MKLKALYEKREKLQEEREYLLNYSLDQYFRPSISSDIVAFTISSKDEDNYRKEEETSLRLLLVRRGVHPFKDTWALPGGFMKEDESIEECAFREILEETNIKPISMKPIGVFSDCDRDPRGRVISNAFVSIIYDGDREVVGGDDAKDAKWFEVTFTERSGKYHLELRHDDIKLSAILKEADNEFCIKHFEILESVGLAFDHAAIIGTALSSLRKDVLDLDILFDFLPKKFTLLKLQKVQETILDTTLLTANFRRKIAAYVEETDEYTTGAGHRPAKLFIRKSK